MEAKKNGSSKDRHISISSDKSNIELFEKEESSGYDSEKDKGNTGQGNNPSNSELDPENSEYSLLENKREKIRSNRSKTLSQ